MEHKKACSFFGHRDVYTNIDNELEHYIRWAIEKCGIELFYVGGHGEFDRRACGAIGSLKKQYPHIELYVALAYLPTGKQNIPFSCDGSVFFEGLETAHKKAAITKRNRLMVEASDVVICYMTRTHGGAYAATRYAQRLSKEILNCADNQIFSSLK